MSRGGCVPCCPLRGASRPCLLLAQTPLRPLTNWAHHPDQPAPAPLHRGVDVLTATPSNSRVECSADGVDALRGMCIACHSQTTRKQPARKNRA